VAPEPPSVGLRAPRTSSAPSAGPCSAVRVWRERVPTAGLLESGVVYGYFRCVNEGNDLVMLGEDGSTELKQSHLERSTDALVAHHPHAKYCSV
jgi:cobalamin-dependent methionine synthase I